MAFDRWLTGPDAGAWIELSWSDPFPTRVSDLVPPRYEAYARVMHRVRVDGVTVRWRDAAELRGFVPHAEMRVTDVLGAHHGDSTSLLQGQSVGVFPQFDTLCEVLRPHTSSEELVVGLWEGFVHEHRSPGLLELSHRWYFLAEIPVDDCAAARRLVRGFTPNIVWPQDRAWFFNTDIDALSTYVGGSEAAIASVLGCEDLETFRAAPDHRV
jgi:hypothetical protein